MPFSMGAPVLVNRSSAQIRFTARRSSFFRNGYTTVQQNAIFKLGHNRKTYFSFFIPELKTWAMVTVIFINPDFGPELDFLPIQITHHLDGTSLFRSLGEKLPIKKSV
jgi:hypothetical protein